MIDFNTAYRECLCWIRSHFDLIGGESVLVRDLYGRFHLVLDVAEEVLSDLRSKVSKLMTSLENYGGDPDSFLMAKDDLFDPDMVFESPSLRRVELGDGKSIQMIDRLVVGEDWRRRTEVEEPETPRLVFFSIKGGVGRSTSLGLLAEKLSQEGKQVMVLDLDLESPGVTHSLLPEERLPKFGIIDWLVEDAIGQGESIVDDMWGMSPISDDFPRGEICVIPAHGGGSQGVMEKLARAYLDVGNDSGVVSFGDRICQLVSTLEDRFAPDVVLIDSRAGLHDIAATAVTRLGADVLFYALNTAQTWRSYRLLFEYWKEHPNIQDIREKLHVVEAMIPETGRDIYKPRFLENAYTLFSETLYEEADAEDLEAFNFDIDAVDAPHCPIPVYWNQSFVEHDPVNNPVAEPRQIEAYFGSFIERVSDIIKSGREPDA